MKKALGQTVRDLKRGVNKKVLKVPTVEQKVLDATSNEPWGPHGSHLADIAQATRNYHECQMIMAIIWKRINDTGKNWRHVYKALLVLEYLVAHGAERVIDEIKEHSYQISTLSDFQYIDSNARDQGSNVRRKSQSLVVLVNDKERIQEIRQKAAVNRDKFRGPSSTGGMYRPNSYSSPGIGDRYDDDRYEERNSYEREREWGYKEDDRYGRNSDPYGRDADRYSRDSDERNARDDDFRGRSQNIDEYRHGSRSRSADREHAYEDDGQHSSRLDRKYSEQNLGAPPSYEEAVTDGQSPVQGDRDPENSVAPAPNAASPPRNGDPSQSAVTPEVIDVPENQGVEAFDEFDPRSFTAAQTTSTNAEMDLLGSLSESFPSNTMAIMPAQSGSTPSEVEAPVDSEPGSTFAAPSSAASANQPFEDPFGDSPFKAVPSPNGPPAQSENFPSTVSSFQATMNQSTDQSQPFAHDMNAVTPFGETVAALSYTISTTPNSQVPSTNGEFLSQDLSQHSQTTDILADILPPAGSSHTVASQAPFPSPGGQPATSGPSSQAGFPSATCQSTMSNAYGGFGSQGMSTSPHSLPMTPQTQVRPDEYHYNENFIPQGATQRPAKALSLPNSDVLNNMVPQAGQGSFAPQPSLSASTGELAIVPKPSSQAKFETKSAVWADTLSKGLVNLNISGAKINPLNDIGIDFDAINRKEKRMEKPSTAPATSNITMGKAMGSGSGIGRAGAGAIRPLGPMMGPGSGGGMGMSMGTNPGMGMGMGAGGGMGMGVSGGMGMGVSGGMGMGVSGGMGMGVSGGMGMGAGGGMGMRMGPGPGMGMGPGPGMGMGSGPGMGMGPGAGMGMGMGPGAGMGMGGYGGMNQQAMGMGMNMGMVRGAQMQSSGLPQGSNMSGGYNPTTGSGYSAQQPYGGGYR